MVQQQVPSTPVHHRETVSIASSSTILEMDRERRLRREDLQRATVKTSIWSPLPEERKRSHPGTPTLVEDIIPTCSKRRRCLNFEPLHEGLILDLADFVPSDDCSPTSFQPLPPRCNLKPRRLFNDFEMVGRVYQNQGDLFSSSTPDIPFMPL